MRLVEARSAPGPQPQTARPVDGAFAALAPEFADPRAGVIVPEFQPGEVVADRYEIRRAVGAGPLYRVYAAHHRAWGIDVAIKVPRAAPAGVAASWRTLPARVRRWIALGAHPHIVYCHYVDRLEDVPLLVLEYRGGGDLRAWMADGRTADPRLALDLAVQVCHGLERAHAAGLRHGGVRPENLLFDRDGKLAIGDFGLSAVSSVGETDPDTAAGELAPYVAPEQWAKASPVDAHTDVFALGVCLYEMLAGTRPEVLAPGARGEAFERFGAGDAVPPRLASLVRRCVASDPAGRPPSVAQLREELCDIHRELFGTACPSAQLPARCWEAEGWNNQAVALALLGCQAEADAAWERALGADATHLEATYNQAAARWRRGEISDAAVLECVTQAAARRRGDPAAGPVVAAVHLARGDVDAAVEELEKASAAGGLDTEGLTVLESARERRAGAPGLADRWSGHRAYVSMVQIAGDGHALSASDDGTLVLWQPGEPVPSRVLEGHAGAVTAVSVTADGSRALSGGDDATLRLWEMDSGQCLKVFGVPGKVLSVALGADATRALVACCDADNFLGIDNTALLALDLDKDRLIARLEGHSDATKCVALSHDGRYGASGSDDQTVRVWDLAHGGHCRRVLAGHTHYVSAVSLNADGAVAASGSWDKTVRVWDANTGRCLRVLNGHEGIVSAVALSADGSRLVSGGWDRTVRVWEVHSGRCLRTFDAHDGNVSSIAISADGALAVSGSWDRTVRRWRIPAPDEAAFAPRLSRRPRPAAAGR